MSSETFLRRQKLQLFASIIPLAKTATTVHRNNLTHFLHAQRSVASDYLVLDDIVGTCEDVAEVFESVSHKTNLHTRIIVTSYNFVWEPLFMVLEKALYRFPKPIQNWLSLSDIKNLLYLSDLEVIKEGTFLLVPFYVPIFSYVFNRYLARLPFVRHFCLIQYLIARKKPAAPAQHFSVSIVIPARNEAGTIEHAVQRIPNMGTRTELIFVEGGSRDNTRTEIERVIKKYPARPIRLIDQGRGSGKGDAVRKGFEKARGQILMILDADLTVAPADLPKFYEAIRTGKGELLCGSRLVYPMEKQAMRFFNIIGNKFFSLAFSWLLDQPLKDTLCGTKVLFKKDYQDIAKNRSYFGNFDPFGDFDLIFGAARLNLKITEVPVRYKARAYGTTNISRFLHGWLLLKMMLFAAHKLKFV